MNLQNDFTQETRQLFEGYYECWICNQNGQDALHHIVGRDSNSPLNCAPIHNFSCHIANGSLATDAMKGRLLRRTRQFLVDNGYELTEADNQFIEKYERLYNTY